MPKQVLLIEDEPNIIEAISFILHRDGWKVLSHSDGETALDRVVELAPDVVVLDVMLPNKSGFEILSELRAEPTIGKTPVLMLTARGQTKDRELAMSLGASDYMTKPFSNDDVLKTVSALAKGTS